MTPLPDDNQLVIFAGRYHPRIARFHMTANGVGEFAFVGDILASARPADRDDDWWPLPAEVAKRYAEPDVTTPVPLEVRPTSPAKQQTGVWY